MLRLIRKLTPRFAISLYHRLLAWGSALYYRFPSRHLTVIGITGTKGKSSTAELMNAVLEEAGHKTALAGTIRFKINDQESPNKYKMTMPGRGVMQHFLRRAVDAGCSHAVIEMTSEGAKQFRHRGINTDMVIVTNISREHIESHGSFENYIAAKRDIARSVERSSKKETYLVVNGDDERCREFLSVKATHKSTYSLSEASNRHEDEKTGLSFTYKGKEVVSSLHGSFNIYNILAVLTAASALSIPTETAIKGIARVTTIPGRALLIEEGQPFQVVVDYAHTPDSLTAVYETFTKNRSAICVLGNAGGGRDKWKRPEMASIAEQHCDTVILTDEDPYDEDPREIVEEMRAGMHKKEPKIIMDRREAIREALRQARERSDSEKLSVLITGKGTDPYIMRAHGEKEPWSDEEVVREELKKL